MTVTPGKILYGDWHLMTEKTESKTAAKGPKGKVSTDVNKSAEIRKVAAAMKAAGEKPRPVVIIATLKKQGVEVSSPQVSMVLKRMGLRPSRGRKAAAAGGRSGAISIEDLLAAKKLVSQFGGTARAMAALEALQKFES